MSRYYSGPSEDHQPVTWLRGYPLYAAHLVVAVLVASLVITGLLMAFRLDAVLSWLTFDSVRVLRGEVWRILSYGLVNPPRDLWFIVDMLMIVWFGRELERFFGRRIFLLLYGGIYLLLPLLATAVGLWTPTRLIGQQGAFALFVAFATLQPNTPLLFNILAKWAALVLIGVYALIALAGHQWMALLTLIATSGFAFLFVRFQQGAIELPRLRLPRRRPNLRVLPDLKPERPARAERPAAPAARPAESMAEVDALLDKIAVSGIGSLTPKERAKLEAAREGILKRGPGRD